MDVKVSRTFALLLALAVSFAASACGTGQSPDSGGAEGGAVRLLLPIDSANMYGFKLAESLEYFKEEGVDVTLEYVDGSGAAMQQILAGNGEIAVVGTGTVIDALEEGHNDVRVVGNVNYGSLFFLTVPEGSDITSPDQLAGKTVGVSELSGGEVPVVRGIIRSGGLVPGEDVELVPIGSGTSLAVRAIKQGQVDALGGSKSDIIAVEAQGVTLEPIVPDVLTTLPGLPVVTTEDFLSENRADVVGVMRATTKGQAFGQANPEAALSVLKEADPEQYTSEVGAQILEGHLPLWRAPEGQLFGRTTVEQWKDFSEFLQADLPEGVDLANIIVDDVPVEANDYDHAAVRQQAKEYTAR